ncbi:hypothetical protein PPACK8108_LOCUS17406 [Phakopsora pachyrhizi]|uniref:Uncharacterized protein n=1 Tax=Phakopsora pachyrhizi TaxID=170000 RepID=A0AAV0B9A8_PHAPC|nr:hypothetical protein PPACK8108_LOCUS17406 [Phakopsora pachyrhizi]
MVWRAEIEEAGAAGARLGFAGLGPRQVAAGAAGAWLGFAGLGPRQVAVRGGPAGGVGRWQSGAGRLAGQGSWVLGRWGSQGQAGAAGAWLGFAGLGPRQVGQSGAVGLAGAARAWLGFAGLGPRQVGQSRAARAWLGFAGLGPRQGSSRLGCGLLKMGRLGRWGRLVGKSRADWLVLGLAGAGRARAGSRQAGAWLGFAGLGHGQFGRQGQGRSAGRLALLGRRGWPGLGSALLGWVLGRLAWLGRLLTASEDEDFCWFGKGPKLRKKLRGKTESQDRAVWQARAGQVSRQAGFAWQVGR